MLNHKQSVKEPVARSLRATLRQYPGQAALVLMLVLLAVGTSLCPPLVLGRAVDDLTEGQSLSWGLAALYLVMTAISDLFQSLQNSAITLFGQKLTHGLRSSLCTKLSRLPAEYFTTHASGQITSIFVNDGDTIDALYSNGIVGIAADCVKILGILAILFTKSRGLFLLLAAIMPLLFYLTRHFQKKSLSAQRANRAAIARVNNHVPETLQNLRMIHTLGKEGYMEKRYDGFIMESYRAIDRANLFDSFYSPVILLLQAVVVAIVMTGAAQGRAMQEFFGMTVGSAVAVISYVGKVFEPLESMGMEIQNIQSAVAGIQHISSFLQEAEMSPITKPAIPTPGAEGRMDVENVWFCYTQDRWVLQDISLHIAAGEHVLLLGPSGSGKSTLFALLMGLYQPQQGRVTLCGCNPADLSGETRRQVYGCVEQAFQPVLGNIRDQVTLCDGSIRDGAVWKALELADLKDTVAALPGGLDTGMQESLFSQGQLQLLSIARAVVKDPKVLLLDEMAANLDSGTEQQVLEALKRAAAGRTVVSISHRYSKFMEGERKVLLRNGILVSEK